jgi:heme exporter protein C
MRTAVVVSATVAAVAFLALPFLVLARAPLAYELYLNQKIFYYHVPAAWVMLLAVVVAGVASAGYLVHRRPAWDCAALAAADLVVAFGAVVMTTGPIWARAAWGVWWAWDARITSALVLWMVFLAYGLVRRHGGPGSERLAAGLALFGLIDVPLVYFAVNLWATQHPGNRVAGHLPPRMREAFLAALLAFTLLFVVLFALRRGLRAAERRLAAAADRAGLLGIGD